MPLRPLSAVRSVLAGRKSGCCIALTLRLLSKLRALTCGIARSGEVPVFWAFWLLYWVLYPDRHVFKEWYSNALAAPLRVLLSSSDLRAVLCFGFS